MHVQIAQHQQEWDDFLNGQRFSPFLQSWTMGEVYGDIGQEPVRLEARENGAVRGVCQAIVVPARRGRHLAVQYGPVVTSVEALHPLIDGLKDVALRHGCAFIRMSPFWPRASSFELRVSTRPSPLHLLAEHLWYIPLTHGDAWKGAQDASPRTEEEVFANMRKTARNLIRRAEKEGVEVVASADPVADLEHFIALHDETRKRHKFTPYTNALFRAQVKRFAPRGECTVYLARHQGEVLAASVHMHVGGETSYHHGASTHKNPKIPASYALQWKAIQDALKRGDGVYNFWGIAPRKTEGEETVIADKNHPFAGVTLFKTGFGGELLDLTHCFDIPLSASYHVTRSFEFVRKWRRGF